MRGPALRMDSLLVLISSPEWDKFDVCKLVSGLIKMVWYWGYCVSVLFCIALQCSPNLFLKARQVCPMYSAGVFGVLLHLQRYIMSMRFYMHM